MGRFRISIATMMGVVLLVAVGFAALGNPSPILASTAFALVVLTLLAGTTVALVGREPFWVGFAVFGWGWLVLSFGPWSQETPVPRPVMTPLWAELYLRLGLDGEYESSPRPEASMVFIRLYGRTAPIPVSIPFLQSLQVLLTLLLACGGGLLGRTIAGWQPNRHSH